jgi:hypothetical protein
MLMGLSFVRHHYIEHQDNDMHFYPILFDYLKAFLWKASFLEC